MKTDQETGSNMLDEIPEPPAHLSGEARAEWMSIVPKLIRAKRFREIDLSAIAAYCQAHGRWVVAESYVAKQGEVLVSPAGVPIQNPYLAVASKAIDQMHRYQAEFGMTPASRSRRGPNKLNEEQLDDAELQPDSNEKHGRQGEGGGRPKVKIDWRVVDVLCRAQSTEKEIAAYLGCDEKTLRTACKRDNQISFSRYFAQNRKAGFGSLRSTQYRLALNGNPTMLIWLGKQYLGQQDKMAHVGGDPAKGDKPISVQLAPAEAYRRMKDGT